MVYLTYCATSLEVRLVIRLPGIFLKEKLNINCASIERWASFTLRVLPFKALQRGGSMGTVGHSKEGIPACVLMLIEVNSYLFPLKKSLYHKS